MYIIMIIIIINTLGCSNNFHIRKSDYRLKNPIILKIYPDIITLKENPNDPYLNYERLIINQPGIGLEGKITY